MICPNSKMWGVLSDWILFYIIFILYQIPCLFVACSGIAFSLSVFVIVLPFLCCVWLCVIGNDSYPSMMSPVSIKVDWWITTVFWLVIGAYLEPGCKIFHKICFHSLCRYVLTFNCSSHFSLWCCQIWRNQLVKWLCELAFFQLMLIWANWPLMCHEVSVEVKKHIKKVLSNSQKGGWRNKPPVRRGSKQSLLHRIHIHVLLCAVTFDLVTKITIIRFCAKNVLIWTRHTF